MTQVSVPAAYRLEVAVDDQSSLTQPTITACGSGAFAVVWTSAQGVGVLNAVVFTTGEVIGPPGPPGVVRPHDIIPINASDSPATSVPVSCLTDDGFAVAWTSGNSVQLQIVDAFGGMEDLFTLNTAPVDPHHAPAIARLMDGSHIAAWSDAEAFVGVRARRYDHKWTAIGDEFTVNTSQGVHFAPTVTALEGGDSAFVIGWQGGTSIPGALGRLRLFDLNGNGGPELLAKRTFDSGPSTFTFLPSGQFVLVRTQIEHPGAAEADRENILAIDLYDATGSETATNAVTPQGSGMISRFPAVRALPNNGQVVTWTERPIPTSGHTGQNIVATIVSVDLQVLSPDPIRVNTAPPRGQDTPCVTPVITDTGDVLAFAWVDSTLPPGPSSTLKVRVLPGGLVGA
jgi:hypothetical protein